MAHPMTVGLAESDASRASSVSTLLHRARSPLTAVAGFAESLAAQARAGTLTTERLLDRLERIRAAAQRLDALLDQLAEATERDHTPAGGPRNGQ